MADIYHNSYITLAATASSNNKNGCFWDSDVSYERTFRAEHGFFSVRRIMKHWERSWTSTTAFPLLSRAWLFQKRLLAPRILHFSHHELVWECMELGYCQCKGYHVPPNPKTHDWDSKDSWASAVEFFTSLHLTVEQDRLPAFFGFVSFYAQCIGASIQRDYFAGLWRKSLHEYLLWRIDSSAHTLGNQVNRLYCCFDCNYGSYPNWRCQYSYSAACSLPCLDQRRLYRYGKADAAVAYDWKFMCSCSENNSYAAMQILQELGARDLLNLPGYEREPYLGPSWSWASARTRVQYWKDIQRGSETQCCTFGLIQVDYNKGHLASPIASATLTVNGHITAAPLQYESLPDLVDRRISVGCTTRGKCRDK
jgi:hypothetical protein